MEQVCVYGNRVSVNENNPSFNYWLNQDLPYIEVKAIITDGTRTWRENIKVSNIKMAENQCKEVIEFFNNTRPNKSDLCRKFLGIHTESKTIPEKQDNEGLCGWLTPKGEFIENDIGEHGRFVQQFFNEPIKPKHYTEIYRKGFIRLADRLTEDVNINSKLTTEQITWIRKNIDLFSEGQKSILKREFKKQGLELITTY
jgi:hypothetical protein